MPGSTCNSAVWSKVLFCDLTRQTLSKGMLTDYNASAAFDRVLHAISVITCRHIGLPINASLFIYNVLHNMEFHLITRYGASIKHFQNNEDPENLGRACYRVAAQPPPSTTLTRT
jgi:hypothetical protein